MNVKGIKRFAALAAACLAFGTAALASGAPPARPETMAPPEAVEACKNLSEGATVEFPTPDGERVRGVCKPLGGQLVAVPDGDGGQGSGGPPPEAIDACKGQTDGASVEFGMPDREKVKGTCRQIGNQLVAVPEVGPGGERKGGRPPRHDNE